MKQGFPMRIVWVALLVVAVPGRVAAQACFGLPMTKPAALSASAAMLGDGANRIAGELTLRPAANFYPTARYQLVQDGDLEIHSFGGRLGLEAPFGTSAALCISPVMMRSWIRFSDPTIQAEVEGEGWLAGGNIRVGGSTSVTERVDLGFYGGLGYERTNGELRYRTTRTPYTEKYFKAEIGGGVRADQIVFGASIDRPFEDDARLAFGLNLALLLGSGP